MKKYLLALSAWLFAAPVLAGVGVVSAYIAPSPDTKLYSIYVAGDAPPPVTALSWDVADYLVTEGWDNLLVGTAKNTDIRIKLGGSNASTATISLLSVSGTTPATAGISITSSCGTGSGSCLSYNGSGAASSGTFRLAADDGTGVATSTIKSFTITNPVSVPGQVTGVQATVDSSTAITISWSATAGATSYKAKRDGAVIQSGITGTSFQHGSLTPSTQYSFTVVATNSAGDGTESSAVLATTAASGGGGGGAFDPDYPRLFLRQAMSNMSTINPDTNQTDYNTAINWVAKYQASMGSSSRSVTYAGGAVTQANHIQNVKANTNYAPSNPTGSGYCKYTNVTQIDTTGASDQQPRDKAASSSAVNNGETGAWYLRSNSNVRVEDTGNGKYKMNYSTFPTADQNSNKWTDWFAKFHFSATGDAKNGFNGSNYGTGNDFVASSGKGLKESQYDCVFEDDMAMLQGDPKLFLDCNDFDEDEDTDSPECSSGDSITRQNVKDAMSGGFVNLYNTWQSLFATQTPRTLQYVIGNITSIVSHNDYWPTNLRGLYNGGLVEEFSGKTKARGFGNLTNNDSSIQPYSGVLGMYKRAMEYSAPPRIVAMGHEPQPEFRTKWGCKPGSLDATCGSVTKANNWVSDGGSCSSAEGTSGTPPAECKYPGRAADFSDYRLMRWALAFVMMSDGYFSTNQTTSTWNTGLPWYDEYVGGSQVNDVGWCGQPLTSAAGAEQWTSQTGMDGVFKREFDNCIVLHNPPRGTPTVDNTKTVSIPAAGVGKRWKRLCAKTGGYTTDGSSGTQDATTNNGAWVGAENTATTVTVKEFDGVFLWRAPSSTTLSCP